MSILQRIHVFYVLFITLLKKHLRVMGIEEIRITIVTGKFKVFG